MRDLAVTFRPGGACLFPRRKLSRGPGVCRQEGAEHGCWVCSVLVLPEGAASTSQGLLAVIRGERWSLSETCSFPVAHCGRSGPLVFAVSSPAGWVAFTGSRVGIVLVSVCVSVCVFVCMCLCVSVCLCSHVCVVRREMSLIKKKSFKGRSCPFNED